MQTKKTTQLVVGDVISIIPGGTRYTVHSHSITRKWVYLRNNLGRDGIYKYVRDDDVVYIHHNKRYPQRKRI